MPFENPWEKTRHDHAKESAEDYVETIFRLEGSEGLSEGERRMVRLTDLAQQFGVSAPTVSKLLSRLETEGLVSVQPRSHVELTEQGLEIAAFCLKRHQIVVDFLRSIGVSERQAELDAEGMEHHVSAETLAAMEAKIQS